MKFLRSVVGGNGVNEISSADPWPEGTGGVRYLGHSVIERSSTSWRLEVSFSQGTPFRIGHRIEGVNAAYTYGVSENSDQYSTHRQAARTGLTPDTLYEVSFEITDDVPATANSVWRSVHTTTVSTSESVVLTNTGRDDYWIARGYTKVWENTPTAADFGKDGNAYFRETGFTNGKGLFKQGGPTRDGYRENRQSYPAGTPVSASDQRITFENAPDGSPALRMTTQQGDEEQLSVTGQQLLGTNYSKVVFSIEQWETTNPIRISHNLAGGSRYHGVGLYIGTRPGVERFPGGSDNRKDGWSLRAVRAAGNFSSEHKMVLYYYPARETSSTENGQTVAPSSSAPEFLQNRWNLIETEMIMNDVNTEGSLTQPDGQINLFQNGQQTISRNDVLRAYSDCVPLGFGLYFAVQPATGSQTIFARNFKIYAA